MKVSKALKIVEEISNSIKDTNVTVNLFFVVSSLKDIKKIVKQENGTLYQPNDFIKYHWGCIKIDNIDIVFRDKKSYQNQK